jgi:hypothetical protein
MVSKDWIVMYRNLSKLWIVISCACSSRVAEADQAEYVPAYGRFAETTLTSIEPRGWLKAFLVNQSEGLTGYLEAAGYSDSGRECGIFLL